MLSCADNECSVVEEPVHDVGESLVVLWVLFNAVIHHLQTVGPLNDEYRRFGTLSCHWHLNICLNSAVPHSERPDRRISTLDLVVPIERINGVRKNFLRCFLLLAASGLLVLFGRKFFPLLTLAVGIGKRHSR